MNVDVLFLDIAAYKPYNWESLENDSIGGTECSTIRLAEGFASRGLKVCVVQKFDFVAQESPNKVTYAPMSWLPRIKAKNVIHLRFRGLVPKFTDTKQFIWFHDAASKDHNNPTGWDDYMIKYEVQGVCVSDWHKQNILSLAPKMPLTRIYCPVDELCYSHPRPTNIDINQLVWMSSPHKGLREAIKVFDQLLKHEPNFKLIVFNPGYYFEDIEQHPQILVVPKIKRASLRSVLAHSLCLFYPTHFEETFGLVAAETNALGTPVMSYGVAALAESAIDRSFKSAEELIDGVLSVRRKRPQITGQDRFRFEFIFNEWNKLFDL